MELHEQLQRPSVLKALVGAKGASDRDQRKAALKYAYYQTWGMESWNDYNFSPAREEGFLRYLDSEYAVSHDAGCATKGDTELPEAQTTGLDEFLDR